MNLNVTTPINALSYGIVGTNIVRALDLLGHRVALWPIGQPDAPIEHQVVLRGCIRRTQSYDRLAPSLRIWHQFDLAQHVGKGLHVAFPIFELNGFRPVELHHLRQQDLIFAPSYWARKVLANNGITNVEVAQFGVDHDIFRPSPSESGPTVFINVGKWELRKGHDVLLQAFCSAFSREDNVRLLMVTSNPFLNEEEARQWESYYRDSPLGEKIQVYTKRFQTQQDLARVMAKADCGVFPSRAEGWGMGSAELLAMGKHVIITDYSAHTEYATTENSRLIKVDRLENAFDGKWFLGDHGEWASFGQCQIDQLVVHLREVHRDKQEGGLGVNSEGIETMRKFTWDNTAKRLVEVLREHV